MRKRLLPLLPTLSLSLLLAACGGGSAPTPPQTLHQGVWGWAIANPSTQTIIDAGAAVFSEDYTGGSYGKVAAGGYVNETKTKSGIAMMGPVSGTGKLETVFSLGTSTPVKLYFAGTDSNNTMELYEGKNTFAGTGFILDANNDPRQEVVVVLVQVDDKVPSGGVSSAMQQSIRTLALQALGPQMKLNAMQVKPDGHLNRQGLDMALKYLAR